MTRRETLAGAILLVALGFLAADRLPSAFGHWGDPTLPLAADGYVLHDEVDAYADFMMSGGPPPDGIPSIDDPVFVDASRAELEPGEKVIGFHHDGQARAYPQRILVHHEIVNDRVGGLNVAVTYCPLTATAQGFERGETTLGVSGQLLNSNLVMFDRETESYFPQIPATAIDGEHRGRSLEEVELVWTTWERWRSVHPDTEVLTDDTGYLRNYERDPYGSYDPLSGYYAQEGTMFPLMHASDGHGTKEMVVGARTDDASVYFVLEDLEAEEVLWTERFLAVYDPRLHTGYVYALDEETPPQVEAVDEGAYEVDGERFPGHDLPLERLVSVEAFHFAWHAFYPESERP